jgi:hypothetical protein
MSMTHNEQIVSDYLQPLTALEPGRRRGPSQQDGWYRRYAGYAVIALAAFALVALIAVLAGHRSAAEQPAKTPPRNVFAKTRGWITHSGGYPMPAVDPMHPRRVGVVPRASGVPLAWSRRGDELLTGVNQIRVLHADGHITDVVGAFNGAAGGSFSPDGKRVIYAKGGSIWSAPANGNGPRVAIVHANAATHTLYGFPVLTGNQLSPDGRTLVYAPGVDQAGERGAPAAIALMNADGSHQRPLVSQRDVARVLGYADWRHNVMYAIAWFGDSSGLLLTAETGNGSVYQCAILAVNTDGSNLRRFGPPGACTAALSPDGKHFAFGSRINHHPAYIITNMQGHVTHTAILQNSGTSAGGLFTWQP